MCGNNSKTLVESWDSAIRGSGSCSCRYSSWKVVLACCVCCACGRLNCQRDCESSEQPCVWYGSRWRRRTRPKIASLTFSCTLDDTPRQSRLLGNVSCVHTCTPRNVSWSREKLRAGVDLVLHRDLPGIAPPGPCPILVCRSWIQSYSWSRSECFARCTTFRSLETT